jgi:hypothetical protein
MNRVNAARNRGRVTNAGATEINLGKHRATNRENHGWERGSTPHAG